MNITYVKSIIERAKDSLNKSQDAAYKEALAKNIKTVEDKICVDCLIDTIDEMDDDCKINPTLERFVHELETSI